MNDTKKPFKVLKISDQALCEIKDLINDDVEVILIYGAKGELSILEGNSERKYLVTDNCTGENTLLQSPKTCCHTDNQFATGEFVACEADEQTVKDFTVGKIVKKVEPVGLTFYTESGCLCNARRCVHW